MRQAIAAAADNAAWCDRVSRTHGLAPSTRDGVWASPGRTPAYYPDAVTLQPGIDAGAVLARVDASPGCSVKDSFADLDLRSAGFEVLFDDAMWLQREPGDAAPAVHWSVVDDADALAAWTTAHGSAGALLPVLLRDPAVRVLARDGLTGGAVLHRGSPAIVGVSNVFAGGDLEQVWAELPGVAARLFPRLPLVGYERGDVLTAAAAAGFEATGPLRVWLLEEESAAGDAARRTG